MSLRGGQQVRLPEGHGRERGGPGRECKAVRRVPAQTMPFRHLPKGVDSEVCLSAKSRRQEPLGSGGAVPERGFLCAKGTEPGTPGTPAGTPGQPPFGTGGLCFNRMSGWGKAVQKQKKPNRTHIKSLFSALAGVLSCRAPLLLPPQFRGWFGCSLCLFPGRGAGRAAKKLGNLPRAPSGSGCDRARLLLSFLFPSFSLSFSPSQQRHIETSPAANEWGFVPLRVRRAPSWGHGEPVPGIQPTGAHTALCSRLPPNTPAENGNKN